MALSSRLVGATTTILAAAVLTAACSATVSTATTSSASSGDASTGSTASTSSTGGAGGTSSATTTATSVGVGGSGGGTTASGSGGASSSSAATSGSSGGGAATSSSSAASSGSGVDSGDVDGDGDGWTPNEGDCCDSPAACATPQLVNPGAFEFPGNNVDDDCDPSTSDGAPLATCGPPPLVTPTAAADLIKAMDLCQPTLETLPLSQRKWGVISATLTLADGTSSPKDVQTGVLAGFGASVVPTMGASMAAISTGTARGASDPGFISPQSPSGFDAGTMVAQPAKFLAAHGGVDPTAAACAPCVGAGCDQAHDSVDLKVRIRVPTNTSSFSFRHRLFTAEYPERLCASSNDFFVAMLTSSWVPGSTPPNQPLPLDGNIAFDAQGHFMSVDSAAFDVCFPMAGAPPGSCPAGTVDLLGTGYGGAGNTLSDGAATSWLIADAPVVPGETIDLEFIVWDAQDHQGDALVLLDRFRWGTPSVCGGPCPHP